MPTVMTIANVASLLLALIALPSVVESAPPPPPPRGGRRRRAVVLRSSARYEGHPTTGTRHDDDNRRRRQQGSPAPDAATDDEDDDDDDDDDEAHLPEVGEQEDGGAASAVVESESEEEEWYLPGLKVQLARTWLYGAGDSADWGMDVAANVNASADDYDDSSSSGSGVIAPVDVPALFAGEHVVDVSAGGMHSAILTDEGRILTAGAGGPHLGRDDANENGNGTMQQMAGFAPVAEVFFPPPPLPLDDDANSTTASTSSSWSSPPPRFIKVVASRDFTFALDEMGNAWSTGSNAYAQLCLGDDATRDRFHRVRMPDEEEDTDEGGDGDGVSLFGRDRQRRRRRRQQQQQKKEKAKKKIVDIALGERHTILLREDGTAWGCGWNHYGQLGVGASGGNVPGPTRIAIDAPDGDDVDDKGEIAMAEGGNGGTMTPVPDHGLIADIVAGRGSSYFLTSSGHVYATGTNYKGQLCLGHREDRTLPTMLEYDDMNNEGVNVVSIVSGASSLYILLSSGLVLACGENTQGQLGIGRDVIDSIDVPSLVANLTNVTAMFSGPTSLGAYFVSERIIYAVGFDGVGARENWNIPNMMACADEETTLQEGVLISSGNDHTLYLATAETTFECEGDPAAAPSIMPSTPATALSSINHVPSVGPSMSNPPSSSSMPMVIMPSVSPTATSSPSATSYSSSMSKEDDDLPTDVPTPSDTFIEFSSKPTSSTPPSSEQASETTRPPMTPTRGVDLDNGANGYPPGRFVLSLLGASVFLCQWL